MALPIQWKVLLIDDEADIREILGVTLEDAGYTVVTAPDGPTGLMLLTRELPQIVITDIKMPGISGLEVLEKIKAMRPETEVIVTTGFGDMKKAVQALQNDASDFISKPIDDQALHIALNRARQRFLDRKQLADYTVLLENENLKTSAELVKNVAFQGRLIENSMDGILGCQGDGTIITFNQSMEDLLGHPKILVLGKKKISDFFVPQTLETLKKDLAGPEFGGKDKLSLYETLMIARNQEKIPVQISGFMLEEEDNPAALILFVSDLRLVKNLAQEKEDQANLLHREKMISLGRLAASMVHEINNPLSGILNYIRLMLRMTQTRGAGAGHHRPPAPFQSYLELIETETQRCSDLVSGLLKFSRKTTLEKKPINLNDLVTHSLMLCGHKLELSNIQVIKECAPVLPLIYGDFNQLEQCVINLVFNALDAMDQGGVLVVKTGVMPGEKEVFISIADTGKGIAEEDLPYIFEPFFTTKQEGYGVGLGLSTAYGIVEKHQGTIVVQSVQGQGTEFTIKLPAFSN